MEQLVPQYGRGGGRAVAIACRGILVAAWAVMCGRAVRAWLAAAPEAGDFAAFLVAFWCGMLLLVAPLWAPSARWRERLRRVSTLYWVFLLGVTVGQSRASRAAARAWRSPRITQAP